MAVTTLNIVEDNTAPTLTITCERAGTAIDLTGCTVTLTIAKGNTITRSGGSCTIISAAAGTVSYQPLVTDFPSKGSYKGDVKITYSDATVEILYEQLKWKVRKKIS
jgi:hypothetical protein